MELNKRMGQGFQTGYNTKTKMEVRIGQQDCKHGIIVVIGYAMGAHILRGYELLTHPLTNRLDVPSGTFREIEKRDYHS